MQISQIKNANELFELEKNNFSDNYSFESCTAELQNSNKIYFGAYINNQIVGYIGIMIAFDQAELLRIAVNIQHRQKGVATALLNNALLYLKDRNIKEIFLEVSDKNTAAINFYQNNQFQQLYTRKNYYSDSTNAIIMQRSI